MFTKEIPECLVPSLTKKDQLKKDVELFEKKSQGEGSGGGRWVCFLQSWFEGGRAKISTMAPRDCDPGSVLATQLGTDV